MMLHSDHQEGHSRRLLIVDDDPDVARLLIEHLSELPAEVCWSDDGERGLGTDLPSDLARQRCWSMPRLRRGWCGLSDGTGVFLHVQVTVGLGGLRAVGRGCR